MQLTYVALIVGSIISCATVWRLVFPKPKTVNSMKRMLLSDVIKLVQETKPRADKVNILQTNMCPGLIGILRMNFDESLELDVDLNVEYRPRKELDFLNTLNHSSKTWKSFTKESAIPRSKKKLKLKAMLESLEPREALLFLEAANRNLKLGISKTVLNKCFPNLFKDK